MIVALHLASHDPVYVKVPIHMGKVVYQEDNEEYSEAIELQGTTPTVVFHVEIDENCGYKGGYKM